MKKDKFDIPIYFGTLVVWVCKKKHFDYFNVEYGLNGDMKSYGAFTFKSQSDNGYVQYHIVLRSDGCTEADIFHEVVHVVNHIFRDRHIALDNEYDKPQAYLTGWVGRKVRKVIKKRKVKVYS
jgi:hypothetical protein